MFRLIASALAVTALTALGMIFMPGLGQDRPPHRGGGRDDLS